MSSINCGFARGDVISSFPLLAFGDLLLYLAIAAAVYFIYDGWGFFFNYFADA
jgi:hypothetical protein